MYPTVQFAHGTGCFTKPITAAATNGSMARTAGLWASRHPVKEDSPSFSTSSSSSWEVLHGTAHHGSPSHAVALGAHARLMRSLSITCSAVDSSKQYCTLSSNYAKVVVAQASHPAIVAAESHCGQFCAQMTPRSRLPLVTCLSSGWARCEIAANWTECGRGGRCTHIEFITHKCLNLSGSRLVSYRFCSVITRSCTFTAMATDDAPRDC